MKSRYTLRRAQSDADAGKLRNLYSEVFPGEEVDILAETMFHHLPGMEKRYWFMVEEEKSLAIVSAFAFIPWQWEIAGIRIKIAEMGLVGTLEAHRGRGLMRKLNREFEQTLRDEGFDLSVIQGIPGFYHKLGYHYAVPLENHINLPLAAVIAPATDDKYKFRPAHREDIPFLMEEDKTYRSRFAFSVFRDESNWRYLFTDSLKTEYGSEFWIMESGEKEDKYYFRLPNGGFGKGLIVSEISDAITRDAATSLFGFLKKKAEERNKPFIRFNLHNDSTPGKIAISMGGNKGAPYAWQVKFPDKVGFLKKISSVLEARVARSVFRGFSETIRLDLFQSHVDLTWTNGKLVSVESGGEAPRDHTFCISEDLFPALCLGHASWKELRKNRPDIFPASLYVDPAMVPLSDRCGLLMETLFPQCKSWVHVQY